MKKLLKMILKYSVLFSYGGMIYVCIELLFRGRSDVSMLFCGAISFICIGLLNQIIPWKMPLYMQSLISGFLIVTPLEYIFGIIFNQNYQIWDYRNQFCNVNGHICLLFSVLWCLLSVVGIVLDDYLRYWLFNEDKPHYRLF